MMIGILKRKDYSKSGIYKITNNINGKIYIGSAVIFKRRWYSHGNRLKRNVHENKKLQCAYNKYGRHCFSFDILEYCEKDRLEEREQYYLNILLYAQDYINKKNNNFDELGYNIQPVSFSNAGVSPSAETRLKMSMSRKGKKLSLEWRINLSMGKKGVKFSKLARINMAIGQLKLNRPPWNKGKHNVQSYDFLIGKKRSKITRERISKTVSKIQRMPVIQYSRQWKYIKQYPSIKDAGESTGIERGNISRVCNKKAIRTGGCYWRFKRKKQKK